MKQDTAAERAVAHIVRRMREDASTHYQLGYGTQSFELLCAAMVEMTGDAPEAVQAQLLNCTDRRADLAEQLDDAKERVDVLEEIVSECSECTDRLRERAEEERSS